MRALVTIFLCACFPVRFAIAQSLAGPIESFTFDELTRSLRAVRGIPGSATLGPAVVTDVTFGTAAPSRNYGIILQQDHFFFVSALDANNVISKPISGIFARPDGAAWSTDGSFAVLFSRASRWVQTITGLPNNPKVNPHQNLAVLGGELCGVAVRATSSDFAVAMCGRQAGVYLNTSNQQFAPVPGMMNPIAVAFSEDGETLYVWDGGLQKLAAVRVSDLAIQHFSVSGLHNPTAVQTGHDASNSPLVYLASRSDGALDVYNPSSGKVIQKISLTFQPEGIQAFGHSSFLLSSRLSLTDPIWLLETSPKPAVYFVPAMQGSEKGAR